MTGEPLQLARAKCRTSDITLAEFGTLTGKRDGANPGATTVEDSLAGTPNLRAELYCARGTLVDPCRKHHPDPQPGREVRP